MYCIVEMFDRKLLINACKTGNLEKVKELIKYGFGLYTFNKYKSPLTIACKYNQINVLKLLIENGADINCDNRVGFVYACKNGYTEIVELLINNGIDVKFDEYIVRQIFQNGKCSSASVVNTTYGYIKIVKILIDNKNEIIPYMICILNEACRHGNMEIVQYLFDKKIPMTDCNEFKQSIIFACENGNIEIVKLLLQKLETINLNNIKIDSFVIACKNGHLDIINFLIDDGIDINGYHSDTGCTAFEVACEAGHTDVVRLLINKGLNIHAVKNRGFLIACRYGRGRIMKLLLDYDINVREDNYFRYLSRDAYCYCVENSSLDEYIEAVKLLFDIGADFYRDEYALYGICKRGNIDFLKIAIENKVDILSNCEIYTAFQFGHAEIVKLFIQMGVNLREYNGKLLSAASQSNNLDLVQLLLDADFGKYINDNEVLEDACFVGDLEMVKFLIQNGLDPKQHNGCAIKNLCLELRENSDERFQPYFGCDEERLKIGRLLIEEGISISNDDFVKAYCGQYYEFALLLIYNGVGVDSDLLDNLIDKIMKMYENESYRNDYIFNIILSIKHYEYKNDISKLFFE